MDARTHPRFRCASARGSSQLREFAAVYPRSSRSRRLSPKKLPIPQLPNHLLSAPPQASPSPTSSPNATASQLEYLPNLSRVDSGPWAPFFAKATGLVQLGHGHWCLRQDFWLSENIWLNTHILELRGGDLLMISPPPCTEEARALLDSIPGGGGRRVRHVVLPNLLPEHWYGAPEWAPYLARDVTVWTAPGLLEMQSSAGLFQGPAKVAALLAAFPGPRLVALPENGPLPGELEGQVEVATLRERTGIFTESVLHLVDYRAAVFTDSAFAAIEQPPGPLPGEKQGKIAAGIYRKLGCPFVYPVLQSDPAAARPWLDRLLAWRVECVFAAHLDPVVQDGDRELRQCFDFVLAAAGEPERHTAAAAQQQQQQQ